MAEDVTVSELRLVVRAPDFDAAVHFYRDVLGLAQSQDFSSPNGRVILLAAGRATMEIVDERQAGYIDEVEVGRSVAGPVRIAFQVASAARTSEELVAAGATVLAAPTVTPWNSLNARLAGPAGLQLTLFEEL